MLTDREIGKAEELVGDMASELRAAYAKIEELESELTNRDDEIKDLSEQLDDALRPNP